MAKIGQKTKGFFSLLAKTNRQFIPRKMRRSVVFSLVLLAVGSQWWLIGSWLFGELMNKLSHQSHLLENLSIITLIFLNGAVDVTFRSISYYRNTLTQRIARAINDRVQTIFWKSYTKYDLQDRESKKMQDALANARNNQGAISEVLQTEIDLIHNTIILTVALVTLCYIVWWGPILLLFIVFPRMYRIWNRKKRQYKNEKKRKELERYQGALSGFMGSKDARINQANTHAMDLFNSLRLKISGVNLKNTIHFFRINWLNDVLFFTAEALLLLYLTYQIGQGKQTIGVLFVFFNSFNRLSDSLTFISEKIVTLGITIKKAEDFYLVVEGEPAISDAANAKQVDDTSAPFIEFRNVWFKYPESEQWILRNCSFSIKSGERVGLVGKNGEGKTTLALLLLRFYDVTEGSILINGMDIKLINRDSLLAITGVLFQDFRLLEGSVRFTLAAFNFRKSFSEHELWRSLEAVGMDTSIRKFKHGLNHKISKIFDDSTKLSGGQSQKIGLAGVACKDPKLLVLDEFTASLDTEALLDIVRSYDSISKGKTCLIISHQFNTLDMVDRVIVLSEGCIVENGPKQELLTIKNGVFKKLHDASRLVPLSLS